MSFISADNILKRTDDIVSSNIEGETVMMSIENGKYYALDYIGRQIWKLLEKPISLTELCNILVDEYDVKMQTCKKDVLEFLEQFSSENLLLVQ